MMVVWLRLLELPLEYYKPTAIMVIAAKVGKPLTVNEFTDCLWKIGYARVKIELDATKPLKPGILIQRKKKAFWQPIVYENLPVVCYWCGRIGHTDETCTYSNDDLPLPVGECPLRP